MQAELEVQSSLQETEVLDGYVSLVHGALDALEPIKYGGRIERIQGQLLYCSGPVAQVGELCRVLPSCETPRKQATLRPPSFASSRDSSQNSSQNSSQDEGLFGSIRKASNAVELYGEVIALEYEKTCIMLYDLAAGLRVGDEVIALGHTLEIPVSSELLGRIVDPLARPLDQGPNITAAINYPVLREAPPAMERPPIDEQLAVGLRAIDGLLPLGKGQRVGIFSGSGVGKSTLLGMIARNTTADVIVIALIGERSREVREFLERDLGEEGRKRSVLVVSTSNSPSLARIRGAYSATAIAEFFRDQGRDVLLLFDSVTRFATAGREVGLAAGEPPTVRGFPPSVFHNLPLLLERAGRTERGSITGIYNVLVEGDDLDEPISDAIRGILDGHVILNRRMAERYHYPAIDVPASVSRLEQKVIAAEDLPSLAHLKQLLAVYREREDLIEIGAYVEGSNPVLDEAIARMPEILQFLQQGIEENCSLEKTKTWLRSFMSQEKKARLSAGLARTAERRQNTTIASRN